MQANQKQKMEIKYEYCTKSGLTKSSARQKAENPAKVQSECKAKRERKKLSGPLATFK